MRRTKEESAATRRILLDAALVIFSEKGYSATRLEDIAAQAGVTRGAIYWHFKNKAELYNTLIETFSQEANAVVERAIAAGGGVTDIFRRVLVDTLVCLETNDDFRAINELVLFKTERSPELEEGWQTKSNGINQTVQSLAEGIRGGIAAGEFRADFDALDVARAFLAFSQGATILWLSAPTAYSLKAQAPTLAEIFLHGITVRD